MTAKEVNKSLILYFNQYFIKCHMEHINPQVLHSKSHEKTKINNALVCPSVLSDYSRLNNFFFKLLGTVVFSKCDLNE